MTDYPDEGLIDAIRTNVKKNIPEASLPSVHVCGYKWGSEGGWARGATGVGVSTAELRAILEPNDAHAAIEVAPPCYSCSEAAPAAGEPGETAIGARGGGGRGDWGIGDEGRKRGKRRGEGAARAAGGGAVGAAGGSGYDVILLSDVIFNHVAHPALLKR